MIVFCINREHICEGRWHHLYHLRECFQTPRKLKQKECHYSSEKIDAYLSLPLRKPKFKTLAERYLCMHVVTRTQCAHVTTSDDDTSSTERRLYECDCVHFRMSGYVCSHVLVCMHEEKVLSVFDLLSSLQPSRKRGRPRKSSNCLKKDDSVNEVDSRPPSAWRNSNIRHEAHKNGIVSGS